MRKKRRSNVLGVCRLLYIGAFISRICGSFSKYASHTINLLAVLAILE